MACLTAAPTAAHTEHCCNINACLSSASLHPGPLRTAACVHTTHGCGSVWMQRIMFAHLFITTSNPLLSHAEHHAPLWHSLPVYCLGSVLAVCFALSRRWRCSCNPRRRSLPCSGRWCCWSGCQLCPCTLRMQCALPATGSGNACLCQCAREPHAARTIRSGWAMQASWCNGSRVATGPNVHIQQ